MDGGGGEGEVGELTLQQVSSHFLRCLAFVHLSMFLHFDSLPVSIRPLQSFGCGEGGSGGEGGGGEGGGGEGEGDGGSRQVFRHFWYFFLHSLLHCFFPAASTAPAKRNTEMKISISFIVRLYLRTKAMAPLTRAGSSGKGQLALGQPRHVSPTTRYC